MIMTHIFILKIGATLHYSVPKLQNQFSCVHTGSKVSNEPGDAIHLRNHVVALKVSNYDRVVVG